MYRYRSRGRAVNKEAYEYKVSEIWWRGRLFVEYNRQITHLKLPETVPWEFGVYAFDHEPSPSAGVWQ
jgi:hypothetical protein